MHRESCSKSPSDSIWSSKHLEKDPKQTKKETMIVVQVPSTVDDATLRCGDVQTVFGANDARADVHD
jgi:hypothetical protein